MRPVKGSDPIPGNGEKNGIIGLGLGPDHIPVMINIKVSHGENNGCEVAVPSDASFGHLKSVMGHKMGLKPEILKLLFRGIEKGDDENLKTAGVKNNSTVLLLIDDVPSEQKIPEEVKEGSAISIGGAAVAAVREEVDKLAEKVSALKVVVDNGTKVDEKDILYLTEMLMRQLLKLDGIEAEGEGKVQRKQEVRRVQGLVETVDILKSKNSSTSGDADNTESVSTPGTLEPDSGSWNIPTPAPPSAPQSAPSSTSPPLPPSAPQSAPSSTSPPVPPSAPQSVPTSTSPPVPPSAQSPAPVPSSLPSQAPALDPSVVPHPNTSVAPPHSNLYPELQSHPHVDPHSNQYPDPHSNPYSASHSYSYSTPHSNLYSESHPSPYPIAYSGHYASPYPSYHHNYADPHSAPYQVQYPSLPNPLSYSAPYPGQYSSQSSVAHTPYPYPAPHSNPPYPPLAPHPLSYPAPHSDPYDVSSSNTKVTQNWERFD